MIRAWPFLSLACLSAAHAQDRLEQWRAGPVVSLEAKLHHVQGIDIEDGILWVSSVDAKANKGYLARFELKSGRLLAQVEVQEGRRIHPGGIALDGDSIWVPVAEYNRRGPTTIERRNKKTLERIDSFNVDDHIGSIAAGPRGLVGGNWDSVTLYRWDRDGKELSRTLNPTKTAYQDLKLVNGRMIGSGLISRGEGAIEWLDPDTFALVRRVLAGKTSRGVPFTQEGMTFRDGTLYLLPEDGPSRLFSFSER
ncbi:MAG: hypothetical protein EXQ52_14395 [Bryobacterales bacterium]|nr:hypothetical protein [Bryobacterales bacterium]